MAIGQDRLWRWIANVVGDLESGSILAIAIRPLANLRSPSRPAGPCELHQIGLVSARSSAMTRRSRSPRPPWDLSQTRSGIVGTLFSTVIDGGIDRLLIVGDLALHHFEYDAIHALALRPHQVVLLNGEVLLRHNHAGTEDQGTRDNQQFVFIGDFSVLRASKQRRGPPSRAAASSNRTRVWCFIPARSFVTDYAGAAPRGSRSRPVRQWRACRCGRSCIRATAPR